MQIMYLRYGRNDLDAQLQDIFGTSDLNSGKTLTLTEFLSSLHASQVKQLRSRCVHALQDRIGPFHMQIDVPHNSAVQGNGQDIRCSCNRQESCPGIRLRCILIQRCGWHKAGLGIHNLNYTSECRLKNVSTSSSNPGFVTFCPGK
jgi:hypothetical protein